MKTTDKFSADMSKVFSLVSDSCGGYDIQESLFAWFNVKIDSSSDNEADWTETFTYDDTGMFYVLYDLTNYDVISLCGRKVSIEDSNYPEIAVIIEQYAKQEIIDKVYEALFN